MLIDNYFAYEAPQWGASRESNRKVLEWNFAENHLIGDAELLDE